MRKSNRPKSEREIKQTKAKQETANKNKQDKRPINAITLEKGITIKIKRSKKGEKNWIPPQQQMNRVDTAKGVLP